MADTGVERQSRTYALAFCLAGIVADVSGCGVTALPTAQALAQGDRPWALLPPSLLEQDPPPRHVTLAGLVMWNRVAGAFRASRGDLDAWVAGTVAAVRS